MKLIVKVIWIIATVTLTVKCKSLKTDANQPAIVQDFPATTREPSLQAYGLPKRVLISNGQIEKVNSGGWFVTDKFSSGNEHKPSMTYPIGLSNRRFSPRQIRTTRNERVVPQHSGRISRSSQHHATFKRSIGDHEDEDLQAEESKVFRPLFVYRQQQANRHRAQRSRNLGYGTYQNGRQSMNYPRHVNDGKHKIENNRRANALN